MGKTIASKIAEEAEGAYVSERKIYPRETDGTFQRLRLLSAVVLLGLFYGVAWIEWGERQAVLWDLPARKFYIFGLSFWPQDFIYLALILIMAGLALFFFTAIAGRLWCGYACPQTVWTEIFLRIEQWFEGDRAKRMKLDAAPWSREKILRKLGKHSVWIIFALWTGFTFVGYFTPIRTLADRFVPFQWGGWETFWVLFYAFATWGNAGFMREQVCKYMCPYARFQGAMFDNNTLIIAYDQERGEQRGARKRGSDYRAAGLGDCIDCTICVQVCPTGIDIRDGLQYECIACGACIDACDMVMERMGYAKGLVRYATQAQMEGKPQKFIRPRIIVYAALLAVIFSGMIYSIATRTPVLLDVMRSRNALYRETPDGYIANDYSLRVINKSEQTAEYVLSVEPAASMQLIIDAKSVLVQPEEVRTLNATVHSKRGETKGNSDIYFVLKDKQDTQVLKEKSRFIAP